jgi:hypothetical protein
MTSGVLRPARLGRSYPVPMNRAQPAFAGATSPNACGHDPGRRPAATTLRRRFEADPQGEIESLRALRRARERIDRHYARPIDIAAVGSPGWLLALTFHPRLPRCPRRDARSLPDQAPGRAGLRAAPVGEPQRHRDLPYGGIQQPGHLQQPVLDCGRPVPIRLSPGGQEERRSRTDPRVLRAQLAGGIGKGCSRDRSRHNFEEAVTTRPDLHSRPPKREIARRVGTAAPE